MNNREQIRKMKEDSEKRLADLPDQEKNNFEKAMDREITITMRDFVDRTSKIMGDIVLATSGNVDEMFENLVIASALTTKLTVEFFPEEIEKGAIQMSKSEVERPKTASSRAGLDFEKMLHDILRPDKANMDIDPWLPF